MSANEKSLISATSYYVKCEIHSKILKIEVIQVIDVKINFRRITKKWKKQNPKQRYIF